ncbi:MAG: DUF1592 domain-containing protein [Planctomycetota bacterium]|nr:DUF1592 domain-containing protein [Planctomycetota bacterium]
MINFRQTCFAILIALQTLFLVSAETRSWATSVDSFLKQNCHSCHNAEVTEANLNLANLKLDPTNRDNFAIWKRVIERVANGEMPPKEEPRPSKADVDQFVAELEKPLLAADQSDIAMNGRVRSRRLTRVEYEHTLHDLLGIDIPLKDLLPEDPSSLGFETVASGQQLSHYQLTRYLDVADIALEEAFERASDGDREYRLQLTPEQLTKGEGKGNYRGPEFRNGESISWPIGTQFYGRMTSIEIPDDGWYRVTLRNVRAINSGEDGAVWGTLRSGVCYSNAPLLYMVGLVEATTTPRDIVYEAWIQEDHILELKPNDGALKRTKTGLNGGTVSYKDRDIEKEGVSGIAHQGVDIERIYPIADHTEISRNLFGDVDQQFIKADPTQALDTLVAGFASKAFRRPLDSAQLAPYREIGQKALSDGESFTEALRCSYLAILCSPRFLTFIESPGVLDAYAVASRLSYALWVSMPDEELIQLAKDNSLVNPRILAKQIERMIDDPKSNRFVRSYSDQWLKLNQIDFTSPDPRQFRDFDPVVQESMVLETRAYIKELIRENLSIDHLIDSEFAFLNGRLARHYQADVSLVSGEGIQKVQLSQSSRQVRGGLISQAAILKVTADGTSTSPVVRGVFINERILGVQIPPPPPGIPAIEPDIRGATSIREQLDKHRSNPSCASCHMTIDPPGFALESFDPVGRWRTNYGIDGKGVTVNAEGRTPEGAAFDNLTQWKKIYRERDEQLAKGFAEQFLTYATGAPIQFSDKKIIQQVVQKSKLKDFGMRSIILESLTSAMFLNK